VGKATAVQTRGCSAAEANTQPGTRESHGPRVSGRKEPPHGRETDRWGESAATDTANGSHGGTARAGFRQQRDKSAAAAGVGGERGKRHWASSWASSEPADRA